VGGEVSEKFGVKKTLALYKQKKPKRPRPGGKLLPNSRRNVRGKGDVLIYLIVESRDSRGQWRASTLARLALSEERALLAVKNLFVGKGDRQRGTISTPAGMLGETDCEVAGVKLLYWEKRGGREIQPAGWGDQFFLAKK